jgi:glycosyltransferase involved in cell wall biosynthesis
VSAVKILLGDPDTRRTLRQAAREEAERWGWGSATDQLRGYYARVVHPSKVPLLA